MDKHIIIQYRDDLVSLGNGITEVGRSFDCELSIADPSVSRRHMRFVRSGDVVRAEDLGSTNGTFVNGVRIEDARELASGDLVQCGDRRLHIRWVESLVEFMDSDTFVRSRVSTPPSPDSKPAATVLLRMRRCEECGASMLLDLDQCPSCDSDMSTLPPTQIATVRRREHPRQHITLPLFYRSESLEVEAKSRDLSLGGVFVSTPILDAQGTECELRLGSEGHAVRGKVARVEATSQSAANGLGVEFTEVGPAARAWLESVLELHSVGAAGR